MSNFVVSIMFIILHITLPPEGISRGDKSIKTAEVLKKYKKPSLMKCSYLSDSFLKNLCVKCDWSAVLWSTVCFARWKNCLYFNSFKLTVNIPVWNMSVNYGFFSDDEAIAW